MEPRERDLVSFSEEGGGLTYFAWRNGLGEKRDWMDGLTNGWNAYGKREEGRMDEWTDGWMDGMHIPKGRKRVRGMIRLVQGRQGGLPPTWKRRKRRIGPTVCMMRRRRRRRRRKRRN